MVGCGGLGKRDGWGLWVALSQGVPSYSLHCPGLGSSDTLCIHVFARQNGRSSSCYGLAQIAVIAELFHAKLP